MDSEYVGASKTKMNSTFGEGDLDLMGYGVGPSINYTTTSNTTGGMDFPLNGDSINLPYTTTPYPYIITNPIYPNGTFPMWGGSSTITVTRKVVKEFVPSEGPSTWRIINKGKLHVQT